jgi:integrase
MRSINKSRTARKDGTFPIQVTVRVPGNPASKSGTYDTMEECEEFAAKAERLLRLQAPAVRTRKKELTQAEMDQETLKSTFGLFLKSKYANARNKKHAPAIVRNIGNVKRCGITLEWVENYIAHMRAEKTYRGTPYAWETIASQLVLINKALKWRADDQRLVHVRVPFSTTAMFPPNWQNKRTRRFNEGEEAALMKRLSEIRSHGSRPFWILFVELALETGARLQELLAATWADVTWDERDWFIPKSKTGERHVPLSQRAMDLLRQLHQLRHAESARVFHELGKPDSVSAMFRRYAKQAGLVDFKLHDLRHEAISRLVIHKRKMSLTQIGLMVGHSSEEMTARYTHLRGREVAELLD